MTYIASQRRGLQQLRDAGIVAILDHHALPGVQTAGQMFTGRLVISNIPLTTRITNCIIVDARATSNST